MAVSDRSCVMNQGQILQSGSAEDLYYRSKTPFVAQFIGRVNMLSGEIKDVQPNTLVVEILNTKVTINNTLAQPRKGQKVYVVLRLESVQLIPSTKAPLLGRVASRTFLGEKAEYLVECQGTILQVLNIDRGPHSIFTEGMEVGIQLIEDTITVLEEAIP
ncbi:MAG: TOBE domain-containing protein [Spirochaetales bacterium]